MYCRIVKFVLSVIYLFPFHMFTFLVLKKKLFRVSKIHVHPYTRYVYTVKLCYLELDWTVFKNFKISKYSRYRG